MKINKNIFPKSIFFYFFLMLLFSMCFIFFAGQLKLAAEKHFWLDEEYGMRTSMKDHSYFDILLHGAKGQGSPAPLDYLVGKLFIDVKQAFNIHLQDEVYFRLWPISVTVLNVFFIAILFLKNIADKSLSLPVEALLMAMVVMAGYAYLFSRMVYYYAIETRPYALWNALWMLSLGISLLNRKTNRLLVTILVLLALSATASLFQLGMMAVAFFFLEWKRQSSLSKGIFSTVRVFILPLLVSFYYCLQAGEWSVRGAGGTFDGFMDFWTNKAVLIPLMGSALVMCFVRLENRQYALAPLSALLLFLIGPMIFYITKLKGFFYVERQFIYYEMTNAVFLLTIVQCLPALLKNLKLGKVMYSILAIIFIISFNLTFRSKLNNKFIQSIAKTYEIIKN